MGTGEDHSGKGMMPAKEVLILAESEAMAENVFSLMYSSSLLAYPDKYKIKSTSGLREVRNSETIDFIGSSFGDYFIRNEYLYIGVLILLKSWGSPSNLYSIEKYEVTLGLDSFTPHSANPIYGQVFDNFNPSYHYHVIASYAIICAFSIIEEIGLEIRSSATKQRFIKEGASSVWNPVIYNETDDRLKEVGLSASYNFPWVERGAETEVQKDIKPKFGAPAYPGHPEIRDVNMELIEAIHRCSYIRNFIAAHKFKMLTQFISPYDVYNVQCVSRLLLVHKLGLWNNLLTWRDDIK
ncbi:hypothetical protein [Mucilaginibacter sp. SG564]|uniref:hypothetical protein n=1 Tax=Mucilaginibacter sp. SG564 TaxID=2587022 RepID=UPI001556AEA0|nr:hypothetical protein [Mucilaginibacter sp. SG564]NOW94760.1 hypothetical protein [Mucilaginibacter sp. SG564]